jgi:hypothetical protein
VKPFLVIADLVAGGAAIVSVDPTDRVGDGCRGIVQSVHPTRADAERELKLMQAPETGGGS